MAIEVFNRHEQKYFLDTETFQKVLAVMDEHMIPDKYNNGHLPYTISNIYYDTDDNRLIRTSISKPKPKYKEKLRLRAYGVPDMDSTVFLKSKRNITVL